MVALPPFRLTGGVFTTPMEATGNDFVTSVNIHSVNGVLQKRQGSTPTSQYGKAQTGVFVGWGNSSTRAEPGTTSGSSSTMGSSSNRDLYIGCNVNPIRQFHINGTAAATWSTWAGMVQSDWSDLSSKVDYWNGTAWTALPACDLFREFGDGAAPQIYALNSFRPWASNASSSPTLNGIQLRGLVEPPSDWAAKYVGGFSAYWLRIRDMPTGLNPSVTGVFVSGSTVTTEEHPILDMLYFVDQRGTRHEFIVYLYSGTELRYSLDGVNLVPSDDIQPDGTSKMFSATTRVWSYYDFTTDRVIGFVQGLGWFYVLATSTDGIYGLQPDPVAAGTPYASVIGGLRSTIPSGAVSCVHNDRIFTANDVTVVYSSPAEFKDIWPNDNEMLLQDAHGPVTAMCSVGGVLACFKRDSIWVAQSDGSADGYTAFPLPGNVGTIAPRSVAVAGGVAWFLAEDGIYTFDGERVTKKSRRIDGLLQRELASSNASNAIGVYHTVMNQYRLYYPGQDSLPWVMSDAIYCSVDTDGEVSFWPQGKNLSTDPGFNATFIASDSSAPVNRIMLGDRYGCIWQMDNGLNDGARPVTFYGLTHRVKLGDTQKMLVRWVTPTTKTWNNLSWNCAVLVDGNVADKQTVAFGDDGENPSAAFHATATVEATATTYSNVFDMQTVRSGSVAAMGRFAQLEVTDTVAQKWEIQSVELDVNRFGRRG